MAQKNDLTFEKAILSLEELVKALEKGEATLDESLDMYSKGMELIKYCNSKLDAAQGKISIYTKGPDLSMFESDFGDLDDKGSAE